VEHGNQLNGILPQNYFLNDIFIQKSFQNDTILSGVIEEIKKLAPNAEIDDTEKINALISMLIV